MRFIRIMGGEHTAGVTMKLVRLMTPHGASIVTLEPSETQIEKGALQMRFSKRKMLLKSFAIVLVSVQANGLEVKDSKPFAHFEELLRAEGQVEIARARYILNAKDPALMKVLCVKITMNSAGDGYVSMSDDMDDQKARTGLVYAKFKNAFVYDPHTLRRLPLGVSPGSELGRLIEQGATDGDGVLLHGESIKRMADKSESAVGWLTVMANVSESRDPWVSSTLAILITKKDGSAKLDNVVATSLQYNAKLVNRAGHSRP